MSTAPQRRWMTVEATTRRLEVGPERVRQLIRSGALVGMKLDARWMVDEDSLALYRRSLIKIKKD